MGSNRTSPEIHQARFGLDRVNRDFESDDKETTLSRNRLRFLLSHI